MRMILIFASAVVLASCTTAKMNGSDPQQAAVAEPRTPDIFRKPPKQVGHWGSGVGYGTRY
jgi:hypothetical protein